MKLTDTLYYFLPVMMGAVGLVLTIWFGSADAESGASQKKVIPPSAESICLLPGAIHAERAEPSQRSHSGVLSIGNLRPLARSARCRNQHRKKAQNVSSLSSDFVVRTKQMVFIHFGASRSGISRSGSSRAGTFVLGWLIVMPVLWLIRHFTFSPSRGKSLNSGLVSATIAFGSVDTQSGASQEPVNAPSAESFVYFPAQYTLNAPNPVNEHIQAF